MSEIEYCPKEFFLNCANAMKRCKQCAAYTRITKYALQYKPLTEDSPKEEDHPYLGVKEQRIRKAAVQRKAKNNEKKVEREIAKGTIRSGALNNDGDLSLLEGKLRVEVKDRGVRKSWNLTLEEFLKGRRQHIDVYAITTQTDELGTKTIYMMEDSLFNDILSLLKNEESI